MFINFSRIIMWMFKSFDIAGDTKLLEKLEKDGVRFLLIIKKHWIYSILMSWRVIFVIIIACANVYLLVFSDKESEITTTIIALFLSINVIWWLFIVIIYIKRFYNIQGNKPYIEDIHSAIKKSKHSDLAFENFFNQTILLLILLIAITFFVLSTSIVSLLFSGTAHAGFGMINAFLLIIQTFLFYGYLNTMIDQEMDFKVIIPGKVLFYNQSGFFGDSQSMNAEKIKTINAQHAGFIGAFVNYGNISILTEGDQNGKGQIDMGYIGSPVETVNEIQRVLKQDFESMERNVNILLKKFSNQIGIENISTHENKKKLGEFLKNNEYLLQDIYKNGDEETQQEVRELYILINN